MKKSKLEPNKLLTEVELELMTILWKMGEGSVNDVIDNLPKDRDLAYTSVSTILRILEQKEILTTRKEGRGHIYTPVLTRNDYEAKTVRHMVDRVFATPTALVRQLVDTMDLNDDDLRELKSIISRASKK